MKKSQYVLKKRMGPPHVRTIRKHDGCLFGGPLMSPCVLFTEQPPASPAIGGAVCRYWESRRGGVVLWKILKVNSCVDCMFSLWEGELVCKERLSVEFPGRYIGFFQSTLVSVGIIIPVVNDSASYRGICKHKGRLKISPIGISSALSSLRSAILFCEEKCSR